MDGAELKSTEANWPHTQAAIFRNEGIQKLVALNEKWLSSGGDYVEK
jgi:hypothetical protein